MHSCILPENSDCLRYQPHRQHFSRRHRHRHQLGAPDTLPEAGIVVGGVKETIMSWAAVASLEELRTTGLFLEPLITDRAIVQEVRI